MTTTFDLLEGSDGRLFLYIHTGTTACTLSPTVRMTTSSGCKSGSPVHRLPSTAHDRDESAPRCWVWVLRSQR